MGLEVLHGALVLFCRRPGLECAEIFALGGFAVFLPRVKTIHAGC